MKRRITLGLLLTALTACRGASVSPDLVREWQSRTLYTCCNIHYEGAEVSDANYFVGSTLPFGSPVVIDKMTKNSISFTSGATKLTLIQQYGGGQETAEQYFGKVLVSVDPHTRFSTFPKKVQEAITDGRVERGMTREQVLMSLGYPPTHRTASLEATTWTYWHNRWVTYTVDFDSQGLVNNLSGGAPTRNEPVTQATPVPTPKPKPAAKHKKKV